MAKIKMLVMDVDGTLTDGCIYVGAEGEMMKAFNVQDGYGIARLLPQMGVVPIIITGRRSRIVEKRAEELGIVHLYQGIDDKLTQLKVVAAELGVIPMEIAYIGDDLNDLDCISYCGYTACPADAVADVVDAVDYVCNRNGGHGAVREFIGVLLEK